METIASAAVAFLVGGVLAFLVTALLMRRAASAELARLAGLLSVEREGRIRVESQAQETGRRLEEEKALLSEAQTRLTDAFKALAGDALSANQAAFLQLAQERLAKLVGQAQGDLGQMAVQTRGDLGKHQEALTGLLAPIAEKLKAFDDHLHVLEKLRLESATRLEGQISGLTGCQEKLQKETKNLANALQHPQVRGRWGEVTLRRVVELAGMSAHCDFDEQVTVQDAEGARQRPDLVVRLPGGQNLVVDSKVALEAYLRAVESPDEATRQACLADHARQTRKHMDALASKSYWSKFEPTPEFVVMFIPGESFFAAAVDQDPTLIEDGMASRVVLATPTTLIALLLSVAYGWRQEQLAENAQRISEAGRQVHERLAKLVGFLAKFGGQIHSLTACYNEAVGSLESRLLPAARRLEELGAGSEKAIPVLEPVDLVPRALEAGKEGE
ncbi:MAG TPA: DNA recombination protein RmuC [Myxococcota bacterium]|nr:DNA recombination protein RmuC [Myxococcota bacterium]HRY96597.1 DNA recombination protein RmuC [Myxococcota bacterium]